MTTVTVPDNDEKKRSRGALSRRSMLLTGTSALAATGLAAAGVLILLVLAGKTSIFIVLLPGQFGIAGV